MEINNLAYSDSAVLELESRSEFATVAKDFTSDDERIDLGVDPSFGQLLAYYIVKSAAVRELLLVLVQGRVWQIAGENDQSAVDRIIKTISLTVVGRRTDESRPQLQELVTGPFDASTLDQLVRDAKFCGIPSVLDIRRLVQKLALKSFPLEELPTWIAQSIVLREGQEETTLPVWIFGVPASAAPILNELQLAQVLVTTKIRRHPKVLAAEQMLRSVINTLGDLASSKDLVIFLYTTAEDVLIGMDRDALTAALNRNTQRPLVTKERRALDQAVDTLAAIRERRIWVRALQLSESSIEGDSAESAGVDRFYSELAHLQRGPDLLAKVRKEVAAVLRAANRTAPSPSKLASQINLRHLQSISAESRIGRAIIFPPSKPPYQLGEIWEAGDNWVAQYLRGQPTTYVFSTPELADAVYVAIERIANRAFQAELPSGTVEASKRSKANLRALKQEATEAEFWHGHSWSIRPKAAIWDEGTFNGRVRTVAQRLNKIETVSIQGRTSDFTDATFRWLRQFETDNDIECALRMLESFEIVNRKKTTAAFEALFTAHPEFRGAYAISFGDPKDGAVVQGYFAGDHSDVVKVVTLDQWARDDNDRPLIFVDDCCGSGSQVCDVLAAWFERSDLRESLGEERSALEQEVREKLLKTKVAFLFITAWDVGVKKIRATVPKIGLKAIVFPYLQQKDIPFVTEVLKGGGAKKVKAKAFISRCMAIGKEILESNGVAEEKVESRKFGYGNKGMLLATLVNVPTQTTTLIWESGIVDGTAWEALLPRKKKT